MPGSATLRGALLGLGAATLFGLSAPLAKPLLASAGPLALAGLLYLGGGLGLTLLRLFQRGVRVKEAPLDGRDWVLLAAITLLGGVAAPSLMLVGLGRLSAVSASLLLNLEGVFTIALAVLLFGEHLGVRTRGHLAAGALMMAGVVLLVRERHGHRHAPLVHDHPHLPDAHHRHRHEPPHNDRKPRPRRAGWWPVDRTAGC
jgi:drug/metabolite transporter (DMT)-like permease